MTKGQHLENGAMHVSVKPTINPRVRLLRGLGLIGMLVGCEGRWRKESDQKVCVHILGRHGVTNELLLQTPPEPLLIPYLHLPANAQMV